MGATTFMFTYKGKSAKEAFQHAVEDARFEYGNGGYTGTIAEKSSYTMIEIPQEFKSMNPYDYADHLIDESDHRIDDKWGPAGCIDLGNNQYLFFGWASD